MMQRIFAFGTLKRGFALHEAMVAHAGFLGVFRTDERYPMLIAGPRFAPMMLNEPGVGLQVVGELYETGEEGLAAVDALESVGRPGNFRVVVQVRPLTGNDPCKAFAYMKARALAHPVHSDYLEIYDDQRFTPCP
jgi:gamma-glutamylaminecyclotransferase